MSYTGSNGAVLTAINPMLQNEPPYIPSSGSTVSGRSSSPEHPAERIGDSSSMPPHTTLAMQYVNHSNMSTSYAYADHGRAHGVTDVDVDEKPHYVYETMTDLQDARQRMMNGGPPSRSPNLKDHVEGVKYAGIPNKPRKQAQVGATCVVLTLHVLWNCFLFILVVGAFGLSVYNFLNPNEVGVNVNTPTGSPETTSPAATVVAPGELASFVESMNKSLAELRSELEIVTAEHNDRYQELNSTIFTAVQSLGTVTASNFVDLSSGCSQDLESNCIINIEGVGTPPTWTTCETTEIPIDEEGFRNVNMYCAVEHDGRENNPVSTSLNIFAGRASCICSLIVLTNPQHTVGCKLVIERCPKTVGLNTTDGQ